MSVAGSHVIPDPGGKDPSPRAGVGRLCGMAWIDWRGWVRRIVTIRATPRQVALGVALGSFIAFTPLVGVQMLLAALFATVLGASRKAAMLAVWISNPVTMGPIFAVTYAIGLLLGGPAEVSADVTSQAGAVAGQAPLVTGSALTLQHWLDAGWGVFASMSLGGAVVGALAALMAYRLTHRGVLAYQAACGRSGQAP
jgi:uncharacterized protein